jgi:hypothetical protein
MSEEPMMPPPPGVVSNFAHPQDELHTVNLATQILCMIGTTIILLLRIFVIVRLRKSLVLEDCELTTVCSAMMDIELLTMPRLNNCRMGMFLSTATLLALS